MNGAVDHKKNCYIMTFLQFFEKSDDNQIVFT